MNTPRRPKAPALFRKVRNGKQLQRKVLRRIYIPSDRRFIEELYTANDAGGLRLREDLNGEELKRLRGLAKGVRAARGFLHPVKVTMLAAIVVAVLVFNFMFRDRLVQAAFERGLEEVFQARSELVGLQVKLLGPAIEFNALMVGDRRKPMQNLFELGSSRIELSLRELLRRRLVVEEFSISEIRFGTARSSTAALPPERLQEAAEEDEHGISGLMPEIPTLDSLGLADFDLSSLIDKHFAELATVAAIEAGVAAFEQRIAFWDSRVQGYRQTVNEMAELANSLTRVQVPTTITQVSQVGETYEQLVSGVERIETVAQELTRLGAEIEADGQLLWTQVAGLTATIEADMRYLRALLPSPAEAGAGLAVALLGPELIQQLSELRVRVEDARAQLERLQALAASRPESQASGRKGRLVSYPTAEYPRFLLQEAGVSGVWESGDGAAEQYAGSLRMVSSDPDLLNQPTSLGFERAVAERLLGISAGVDLRSRAETPVSLALRSTGYPYSTPNLPVTFGIERVAAVSAWDLEFAVDREQWTRGFLQLGLSQLELRPAPGGGELSRLLIDALEEAGSAQIEAEFAFHPSRAPLLRVQSDVDALLRERVRAYAGERLAEYEARLRGELESRIQAELVAFEPYLARFESFQNEVERYRQEINAYRAQAEEQRRRVEQQLSAYQDQLDQARREAEARVRAEAEAARAEAEAARAEAERRAAEEQARIEAEAEQQRREAEEAARREAEQRARETLPRQLPRSPF